MKNILLKSLAVAAMFGAATTAFAGDIPGAKDAKAGDIGRHETASDVNEWVNPDNGVYGIHVFAADANDWDSQFFIVFADAVVPAGTPIQVKFDYRKAEGSGVVKFNAQGHADPHAYVNNDGWATLEATEEWQTYEGEEFAASGEIRTLAVNASIGREDGTLYMRNIVITCNYDDVVVTKETTADEAELEDAPVIEIPEAPIAAEAFAVVDYAKIAGDTAAASVAKAVFVGKDAASKGKMYALTNTVKYGDDKVFAFLADTTVAKNAWDVQFFAHWELAGVSEATQKILSFDYKVDFEAAGGWNVSHDDIATGAGNQGAKWGAIQPTTEWKHYADTITDNWFFELHLSGRKTDKDFQNWGDAYNIFLKNVELTVDGKVVAKSNDLDVVAGTEITEKDKPVTPAINEATAIKAYFAGNVLYASEATDMVIYNINGVAVKSVKNAASLNVSDLKSGLYIAKVGNKTVKFVK